MKKYMDIIAGMAFLVLAAALQVGSYSIRTFSDAAYGVTFLPRITALIMAIISLIVLIGGIRQSPRRKSESFGVSRAIMYTCILIFFYILSLETLGFILSSILYISLQVFILSDYSRKRLFIGLLIAIPFSICIYLVFTRVVYIMLPPGIVG